MAKATEINTPTVTGRERRWQAAFAHGDEVTLTKYLVLNPGEEVDDHAPTMTMTRAQFRECHEDFGLTKDGQPLST
jgi:hypothetical protein